MKRHLYIVTTLLAAFMILLVAAPGALANSPDKSAQGNFSDNLKHPLGSKQQALKQKAMHAKMLGEPVGAVYEAESGKYVETARLTQDRIWTVLGQFGTQVNPTYGGTVGPLRNEIPQPDRSIDNTTIWVPDFNQSHYTKLLFDDSPGANSMRNYYLEQSGGQYTVTGDVTAWVDVPYNSANYGSNYCGSIVCARTWLFVRDSVKRWYDKQVWAGKTDDQINAELAQYDVWDRYDFDGDGNFNEPDGYIDHFQSVHAGQGEETGGGAQGTDAIWSHRWYAFYNNIGVTGPDVDGTPNLFGGIRIGNSNKWIGDYTIEPENGGVGVFSHEFGHDLGLPDLYETSGNTGGAENSTGFWTLMSSGSYGSNGKPKDGIGNRPIHMSAYEKIYLGWTDLRVVNYGNNRTINLAPTEYPSGQNQTLIVNLPDKQVATHVGDPYAGSYFYYSQSGNDLDNTMTRDVTLPAGAPTLSAQVMYDIEADWDYLYLTINGDPIETNLSTDDDPNGQNEGHGITGSSGGNYTELTADLSAFAGQTVTVGFRYWTDVATVEAGALIDDIAITGQSTDGAETDPGWTYSGFLRTDGDIVNSYYNAYFGEFRTYWGNDRWLERGPYNFGFLNDPSLGDWVEHFPYQDGLLLWYYDESYPDNNVGDACAAGRCGGLYLPIDAHPQLLIRPDGKVWRPRVQAWDSTFGLEPTPKLCLHLNSTKGCFRAKKARPEFNDMKSYWVAPNPSINHYGWAGVNVPHTGTSIKVLSVAEDKSNMSVRVEFAP